ncbi:MULTISPECIES: hypothetical protein [unclassified Mesorhizobium]|uniref:hypothetical protein n=1 Tax=unclassified Mesorhizobium TaxID=325217 RepID=UPI0003CEE342|nr:hypothetical protein [Mesorhizobium sp. LNJC394B00]ESY25684.1 hypothetical protein X750_03160 [Mesorhizobium sp. LNJC394B00]
MKLRLAFAVFTAGIFFALSAASAGQGEQQNINFLARMSDARLNLAARMAGDLVGVRQRCPALRPTEDGKAIFAVPVLLYDGRDKHLTPDPRKFNMAIHTYERAFAMAAQRSASCQSERAKYPKLYR